MDKERTLQILEETGVVAVIRVDSRAVLMDTTLALAEGGIKGLEITMTSPGALGAIEEAVEKLGDRVIIGVGSVLDAVTARLAILAGAGFVVSPVLKPEIIEVCQRYSIPCIPGAFTPTEILAAWETGADVVKIFPATKLGPSFIKDIRGPLPQVKLTPTGGVNLETPGVHQGRCGFAGVGGALVDKKLVAEKKWADLAQRAAQFIAAVKEARK